MRSMTGYGHGEHTVDGARITFELKAVNRRQAEIVLRLSRELEAAETKIREELNPAIARGRLEVFGSLVQAGGTATARINCDLAKSYARQLGQLGMELGLQEGVTLDLLVRCPGVVESDRRQENADETWPLVQPALRQAIHAFNAMREREGAALSADLCERIRRLRESTERIRKQAPLVGKRFREQLLTRIRAAGLESISADDERVLKEVILFADRCDITEELTRLESHFEQFDDCCRSTEPVGRKLDFLAQEMNREINTIGSKSNDALISADVIQLKTELERFREQAQNIE
jgi:uncharacterized protein (TIGR00255 family)